jgi:hypothetical protein
MKKGYIFGIIAILGLGLGFAISYFLFPSIPKEPVLPEIEPEEEPEQEPEPVPNNPYERTKGKEKPQIHVGTDPRLDIDSTLA